MKLKTFPEPKKLTESLLRKKAKEILDWLSENETKIVFAESCTGGNVSALMTSIPGASESFCGAYVVYRPETKTKWLGISKQKLNKYSTVHPAIAEQLALEALKKTPEAHFAASITGYLGPESDPKRVGLAYVGFAIRSTPRKVWHFKIKLKLPKTTNKLSKTSVSYRKLMQLKASHALLLVVRSLLID